VAPGEHVTPATWIACRLDVRRVIKRSASTPSGGDPEFILTEPLGELGSVDGVMFSAGW